MLHTLQTTHSESIKDRLRGGTIQRLVFAVFAFVLLLATPAAAYEITGGTPEQREYVRDVIEASELDVEAIEESKNLEVILAEHWDPYWFSHNATWGVAYFFGRIVIDEDLEGTQLGETTGHELAHIDWFTLPSDAWNDWRDMVGPGDASVWLESPAENYAETARLYAWAPRWYFTDSIRSDLKKLTESEFWKWREQWNAEPTPTTTTSTTTSTTSSTTSTTVRGRPFPDVERAQDEELWKAAWHAKNEGLIKGFSDGTLGAYEPLLRRHVALVAGRAGIDVFDWVKDYSPATRGEVRDTFIFEWKEQRWDEPLLRSQLLRLLYRASQK